METLIDIAKNIILSHGYLGIFSLTALEQFIFPVPVDIFVAFGTANGLLFGKVLLVVLIATLLGSIIGYCLGKYLGHPVAVWLFGKKRLEHGERFIQKWGILGVILAGLTPIPFKIITWTAGIFEMPFWRYMLGVFLGRMPRYLVTAYAGTLLYKTKFYATTDMSALVLGFFQGITEFLPISSSGHLVIMEQFLKLPISASEMLTFDIFLHGGSLLAILIYFWKDWVNVLKEIWKAIVKKYIDKQSLTFKLVIGTIPAILAGLMFGNMVEGPLRNLKFVAIFFIIIGIFYFYAAWKGRKGQKDEVSLKNAVLIGCAQALALIPGVSRSGITISTGVASGLKRHTAAKFSFMLGAVAIFAANIYNIFSIRNGAIIPDTQFILIGTITSFVFSLASIAFLIKFLQKYTLRTFAVYLIIIGTLILSFF